MPSDDYFMRQVEGISDMLSMLLFDKKAEEETIHETQVSTQDHSLLIDLRLLVTTGEINQAENLLFWHMESYDGNYLDTAMRFYGWLEELEDDKLEQFGFSREEIAEGKQAVKSFYAVE